MPINPSAAGRVRRGKGEGDTPWSNIIAFPPSSKDLCSLFFFFFFSFLSHRQICRTRRQRSRWNASIDGSKSGSLAPKSANDRYRVWDSWNTAFFTCFAATLSIIYWMLEFICGSRAIRKKNDGNDGTIEISRYRACSHLHLSRETLLSLPCLFFHSPGLFDRCYLSARKESEYAFSRKRVSKCLEILMYATRGKGQEKVVSSIFNYIEPS